LPAGPRHSGSDGCGGWLKHAQQDSNSTGFPAKYKPACAPGAESGAFLTVESWLQACPVDLSEVMQAGILAMIQAAGNAPNCQGAGHRG
jgi:hypothetical protein